MAVKVIIPLPDNDFDTTEVSIPWKHFVKAGFEVTFSTETGKAAQTDPRLLTGVIFGRLGAKPDAIAAYRELEHQDAFQHPLPYDTIETGRYDMLLLPGGHAKGMRQLCWLHMISTERIVSLSLQFPALLTIDKPMK